jgi:hypothetical protein
LRVIFRLGRQDPASGAAQANSSLKGLANMTQEYDEHPATPGDGRSAPLANADQMEQVRELLFGDAKRATEQTLRDLDCKIEAVREEILARLAELDSRLVVLGRDTEHNHSAAIDAIGGAIAQLGATVQNMSARRKGD